MHRQLTAVVLSRYHMQTLLGTRDAEQSVSHTHLWAGSGAPQHVTDALHALQSKVLTLSSLGRQGGRPTCDTCSAEQSAFVVTFGRAGEDKKFSKLGDVEQTLQGFAGADYDLNVSCSARLTPCPGCCLAQNGCSWPCPSPL